MRDIRSHAAIRYGLIQEPEVDLLHVRLPHYRHGCVQLRDQFRVETERTRYHLWFGWCATKQKIKYICFELKNYQTMASLASDPTVCY